MTDGASINDSTLVAAFLCIFLCTNKHDYTTNRERELELKTLFYKDCSLGLVKNLSNN